MKLKLALILFLLALYACSPDRNGIFIQGIWQAADAGSAASMQSFVQWQFSRDGFILQQEIREGDFLISPGSYSILESDGDRMAIELYNISGDLFTYNNLPVVYAVEIDRTNDALRINDRLFERVD